jgi:hypothetical protein
LTLWRKLEMLWILKISINQNTIESTINRLDLAKERIDGIEEKIEKYYIQTEIKKKNENEENFQEFLDMIKTRPKNPWTRKMN